MRDEEEKRRQKDREEGEELVRERTDVTERKEYRERT